MRKIGILGFGEVGQSLKEIYDESFFDEPLIKDLDRDELEKDLEVLNVCIAYSDNFNSVVIETIKKYEPRLTMIYSTVAPYTTKTIRDAVGRRPVVHSPMRGVHPNLAESFKKFVRFIGVEHKVDEKLAREHLGWLGLKHGRVKTYKPAKITEFNKLLSTSYYGVCIAFTDYVNKLCQKYIMPFPAFTYFNQTYNTGYYKMGLRNVRRPTLYPPQGKIGGHCIRSNTKLLQRSLNHKLLESILEVGNEEKNQEAI